MHHLEVGAGFAVARWAVLIGLLAACSDYRLDAGASNDGATSGSDDTAALTLDGGSTQGLVDYWRIDADLVVVDGVVDASASQLHLIRLTNSAEVCLDVVVPDAVTAVDPVPHDDVLAWWELSWSTADLLCFDDGDGGGRTPLRLGLGRLHPEVLAILASLDDVSTDSADMALNGAYAQLAGDDQLLVFGAAGPEPAFAGTGEPLVEVPVFWQQDGKRRLESHLEPLKSVVFQLKLGTLYEKSERVSRLAAKIAGEIGGDVELAARAALLSRCDLMTEMVGEFPDMQGVMGRYQAGRDGEAEELAQSMEEFYLPRFSGDQLASTRTGIAISIADRLDTLVGIFGIGQKPTGDKDPFGLRRAALGVLRNLKEHRLSLNLKLLLESSAVTLDRRVENANVVAEVYDFMLERLKGIYQEEGVSVNVFEAVAAVKPETVADFDRRIRAVLTFEKLPEAEALAAANKRISNILKKSGEQTLDQISIDLFERDEERALHQHITTKMEQVTPMREAYKYEEMLIALAGLREPVDRFFDEVMVMAENPAVRGNRLALLNRLNLLFLGVADISRI